MNEPVSERIQVTAAMGMRLRAARERKGLSQGQLADQVHASQPQIDQYEKGDLNIAVERLFDLARILDLSMVDLFD